MGKRSRRRAASFPQAPPHLATPAANYTGPDGDILSLRTSFTAAARREYAETLSGRRSRVSATREDAWQRATELLFERLVVSWTIAGAPIERPRELLLRYRAASAPERARVRDVLREHCAEHFPDVQVP